ncbi:hypothetical protein H257_16946 [Aphanomyces astaci]|uniref:Uncharacterized protein n=1 Tax=Aphanomyces astaci TaxID=112090 RepID=W4FIJ3_APHAT|nr:hypothetical protein, variant [Aphanomyces astaci]XP_009843869.1 hypothetical protein H257_16946 [Aphanomyces astaci]ETV66640.1 hypothetical protein H257_16946 [Aphanomyces astaci]ETV66641.1 hypothetical protein, variant [Aphanomyces astaci]|eukprot:XP_009843868.1 hypothetical protein, variant [Aphanomyces astaci]
MANILAFLTVFAAMASATVNQIDDHQPQHRLIFTTLNELGGCASRRIQQSSVCADLHSM